MVAAGVAWLPCSCCSKAGLGCCWLGGAEGPCLRTGRVGWFCLAVSSQCVEDPLPSSFEWGRGGPSRLLIVFLYSSSLATSLRFHEPLRTKGSLGVYGCQLCLPSLQ